jgi:uncharacterized protein YggU (UPF0235/DUF167 family)
VASATRADPTGVRVVLRARPKSRSERLETHGGSLLLRVAAPAQDGAANQRIIELLAARLGVPRRAIDLVRGHTARDKELQVRGLTLDAARARLVADRPER